MRSIIIAIFVLSVVLLATTGTATTSQSVEVTRNIARYDGPVWHVDTLGNDTTGDGSESSPFATIRHAVELAGSGDTVLVGPGFYRDTIVIQRLFITNKDLILSSTHGPDLTTIAAWGHGGGNGCEAAQGVLGFTNSVSTVSGFCIQGYSGCETSLCLITADSSDVTFVDCNIGDADRMMGTGGIAANDTHLKLTRCTIHDLLVMYTIMGGAVSSTGTGHLEIDSCIFEDIMFYPFWFYGETLDVYGGAVYAQCDSVRITDCVFRGIMEWDAQYYELTRLEGGAVWISAPDYVVSGNVFSNIEFNVHVVPEDPVSRGAGVYADGVGQILHNTFSDISTYTFTASEDSIPDSSKPSGGAVYSASPDIVVNDNLIVNVSLVANWLDEVLPTFGAGFYGSYAAFSNNLIWGNYPDNVDGPDPYGTTASFINLNPRFSDSAFHLAANSPAAGAASDGTDIGAMQGNYGPDQCLSIHVDSLFTDSVQHGTDSYPYSTIDSAVDVAADCDTVLVHPGTYVYTYQPEGMIPPGFAINNLDITLLSTAGADSTLILQYRDPGDCESRALILITNSTVAIEGFNIRGSTRCDGGPESVITVGGSDVLIGHCTLSGGRTSMGTAVRSSNSRVTLHHSSVANTHQNTACSGGGIYARGSYLRVDSCSFSNTVYLHATSLFEHKIVGGAINTTCDTVEITGSIFQEIANTGPLNSVPTVNGGVIYANSPNLYITDNIFSGNSFYSQAMTGHDLRGAVIFVGGAGEVSHNTFVDNSLSAGYGVWLDSITFEERPKGGAIYSESPAVGFRDNIIVNNDLSASLGDFEDSVLLETSGAGFFGSYADFSNNLIWGNYPDNLDGPDPYDTLADYIDANPRFSDSLFHLAANSPAVGAASDGTDIGAMQGNYGPPQYLTVYVDSAFVDSTQHGTLKYPFATIQTGVDGSVSGDTVLVHPGGYHERLVVSDGLSIVSSLGADSTSIVGDALGRVVTILNSSDTVRLAGFEITGGVSEGDTLGDWGAGILVYNAPIVVEDCSIHDNLAAIQSGGGICFREGAYAVIRNNYIHDNHAADGGGIMSSMNSAGGIIENNVIVHNTSDDAGGGMFLWNAANNGAQFLVSGNTISHNANGGNGCGLQAYEVDLSVFRNIISYNTAVDSLADCATGFAGLFLFNCNAIVDSNDVFGNFCANYGGHASAGAIDFSLDPQFCDTAQGDYNLRESSPCAPGNDPIPGILVGALDIGCPGCCVGIRGNIDGDPAESIDISDLVYLIDWMFSGGPPPPCMDEADLNGDGGVDIADLVFLIDYMFNEGPEPVACP